MKKLLEFYTTYFALWVLVVVVLAYCCPSPFLALKPLNKAFFGLTVFGIGAVLKPEDFASNSHYGRCPPRPCVAGAYDLAKRAMISRSLIFQPRKAVEDASHNEKCAIMRSAEISHASIDAAIGRHGSACVVLADDV